MVAVISGADNGSLFMPSGVLTFSRPFAILSFYRKHLLVVSTGFGITDTVFTLTDYLITPVFVIVRLMLFGIVTIIIKYAQKRHNKKIG